MCVCIYIYIISASIYTNLSCLSSQAMNPLPNDGKKIINISKNQHIDIVKSKNQQIDTVKALTDFFPNWNFECFTKIIPNDERNDWNANELKNMNIEFHHIDVIFEISYIESGNKSEYYLLARQNCKDNPIYIELSAYDYFDSDNDNKFCGKIYFSKNPEYFLKNAKCHECLKEQIYKYLKTNENINFKKGPKYICCPTICTYCNMKKKIIKNMCVYTGTETENGLTNFFSEILPNIKDFEKIIPEDERDNWKTNELKTMNVNFRSIDLVFDLHYNETKDSKQYFLLARQNCNGDIIYFEINAFYNFKSRHIGGKILFSKNPEYFLKAADFGNCLREHIYTKSEKNNKNLHFKREKYICNQPLNCGYCTEDKRFEVPCIYVTKTFPNEYTLSNEK